MRHLFQNRTNETSPMFQNETHTPLKHRFSLKNSVFLMA